MYVLIININGDLFFFIFCSNVVVIFCSKEIITADRNQLNGKNGKNIL